MVRGPEAGGKRPGSDDTANGRKGRRIQPGCLPGSRTSWGGGPGFGGAPWGAALGARARPFQDQGPTGGRNGRQIPNMPSLHHRHSGSLPSLPSPPQPRPPPSATRLFPVWCCSPIHDADAPLVRQQRTDSFTRRTHQSDAGDEGGALTRGSGSKRSPRRRPGLPRSPGFSRLPPCSPKTSPEPPVSRKGMPHLAGTAAALS